MGSYCVSGSVSHLAIHDGDDVVLIALGIEQEKVMPIHNLISNEGSGMHYTPAFLPIRGKYNDYGTIDNIVKDDHTALLEAHFNIGIEQIVMLLSGERPSRYNASLDEVSDDVVGQFDKLGAMFELESIYDGLIAHNDKNAASSHWDYRSGVQCKFRSFFELNTVKITANNKYAHDHNDDDDDHVARASAQWFIAMKVEGSDAYRKFNNNWTINKQFPSLIDKDTILEYARLSAFARELSNTNNLWFPAMCGEQCGDEAASMALLKLSEAALVARAMDNPWD